jgi:hypothetical protein
MMWRIQIFIEKFFNQKRHQPLPEPILRTRTQLIKEGKGSFITRRQAYTTINKY